MNTVRAFLALLFISLLHILPAAAQDEPAAAWQVTGFDITVTLPAAGERALTARALLTVRNVGRGPGGSVTLRISPKAEIKAVRAGDAVATFRAGDVRNDLQLVRVTLPAPVAPGASASVAVEYRLPVAGNSGYAALSTAGSQFLPQPSQPLSLWYPAHNTAASPRGADVAPFRLTVSGAGNETVVSAGKQNGPGFEQQLNAQPFFVTGNWDAVEGAGVTAFVPKGAGEEARRRADELLALAAAARTFYAGVLGTNVDAPVRLVAVRRGAGFSEGGTLLLDASAFRRPKLDAISALSVAEAVARLWVGGRAAVKGDGGGVLREGLTRFLATLFLEKQFGREAAEAERARERTAYATIARRDAPLARTSPLDPTYYNSAANKGAMFWRLVERAMGRDALMSLLGGAIQRGAGAPEGLTLAGVRAALEERGGAPLKSLMEQALDQPTDMDLMVGLPQQKGAQWAVALRNSGSLDASVTVAATTANGERLTAQATIPARSFGEATFATPSRLTRAEIDPDKLYPQIDYTNDVAPRAAQVEDPLSEATAKFVRQDFAGSEAAAREMLAASPRMQEARIVLARSLLAQNKTDEAEKEFRALVDEKLPLPLALAWGSVGLAEVALRKGQGAEAVRRFTDAVLTDAEYASTLAARLGRIRAEAAAQAAPAVDDSARTFVAQLDAAIKGGRKAELEALIVPGELTDFIAGIVGNQPEAWQTRVVRTEQLDANRLAADVQLATKQLGQDASGTAVLILARSGAGWKLESIGFFEVR